MEDFRPSRFRTGRAALPTKAEMRDEIVERKAWLAKHFELSPRHGIEVEHLPYFVELKKALKACQRRARETAKMKDSNVAPRPPQPKPMAPSSKMSAGAA